MLIPIKTIVLLRCKLFEFKHILECYRLQFFAHKLVFFCLEIIFWSKISLSRNKALSENPCSHRCLSKDQRETYNYNIYKVCFKSLVITWRTLSTRVNDGPYSLWLSLKGCIAYHHHYLTLRLSWWIYYGDVNVWARYKIFKHNLKHSIL